MFRKAAVNLRLSARVAELCHSEQPYSPWVGHATTIQRLTSTLANLSPSSRVATTAVVDRGGGTGSGFAVEADAIPTLKTGSRTGSTKTAVGATNAATSAASNGAGNVWSTARVIGVSEADAAGGEGGGSSSSRCYRAMDDAEEARSERFVAEVGPPQTMEVGSRSEPNRMEWRGCCCC